MESSILPVKSFSAAIFILRSDGDETKVLLLRRTGYLAGVWSQVAGSIELGEKAWRTVLRETQEETGLEVTELWSADLCIPYYKVDRECIAMVPVFVGMVQKDARVMLNEEHDSYKWVSFEEAREMVSFPRQRVALDAVKDEFVDRTPNPLLKIDIEKSERVIPDDTQI